MELLKYFMQGINIRPLTGGKYTVYTPATGNFIIHSMQELTPQKFDQAIKEQVESEKLINNEN